MPDFHSHINRESPTTELELISQKRSALQKLVKLTATLHRLNQGLQAILLLGRSASNIPEKIIESFKNLSQRLKPHPTNTLKNTLSSTEQKIQRDIKHVLEISQKNEVQLAQQLGVQGEQLLDVIEGDFHEYVNDFKKNAQTSIALRLTLKARNVFTRAFNLPVSKSFVKQQISALDQREVECKEKITHDINNIQSDIQALLQQEECPKTFKDKLLVIKQELDQNMAHISGGKQIDEMPILYESIELSGAPQAVKEVEAESQPAQPEIAPIEVDDQSKPAKRKLTKRIIEWLHTPLKVKWKDINKYR